jgi:hypothetical protein
MAIYSSSISDDTINALLESPDADMRALGQQYKDAKKQQDKELGRDKGILGAISNIFGFGSAQGAEPEMPSSQKFSNQFSVTQPSQFDFKGAQLFDPTNMMRGSVVEDVVDTPTREFGDMKVGRKDQAIFGDSVGQRFNIENNPELFFNTAAGQAQAKDEQDFFDYLQNLSGGVVDFAKDITGRTIASQALGGAGGMINPYLGLAGGIAGLVKGGDLFNTNTLSQRRFDAMTPGQQAYTSSLYNPGGLLEGYNQVSAFGEGALGTLGNRLSTVQNTLAKQGANRSSVLEQREQQIKDAIDRSINIGESEALGSDDTSVDYGITGGRTRTDIDVADGGAETSGGKIVCTMMNESYGFGNFRNKIWLKHSKNLPKEYEIGYHKIFLPLVKFAKRKGKLNKMVKKTLEHVARHRTLDLKQEMKGKTHILGRVYRKILEPICFIIGKVSNND